MEPTDILTHTRAEALLHTLTAEDEAGNKEHTSRGGRTLHTHTYCPGFKSNMTNAAAPGQVLNRQPVSNTYWQ